MWFHKSRWRPTASSSGLEFLCLRRVLPSSLVDDDDDDDDDGAPLAWGQTTLVHFLHAVFHRRILEIHYINQFATANLRNAVNVPSATWLSKSFPVWVSRQITFDWPSMLPAPKSLFALLVASKNLAWLTWAFPMYIPEFLHRKLVESTSRQKKSSL